jgi:hypothetical protein
MPALLTSVVMGPNSLATLADQRANGFGIGDVSLHGDGLAAGGLDLGDDLFRAALAAGVVDCNGCAARRQLKAMAAPMPLDAPVTSATFP